MPFYPMDATLGFLEGLGIQEAYLFIVTVTLLSPFLFLFNAILNPTILASVSRAKHETFATLWRLVAGSVDRKYAKFKKPLLSSVYGVVLDVGSGTGVNLKYYDPTKITKLILIEPNKGMHSPLLKSAKRAGFNIDSNQVQIVPCGAEEFEKVKQLAGIEGKESVDCVTSIFALCSIPESKKVIAALYEYLKPGGSFYYFEHVASKEKETRKKQDLLTPFWRQLFDGCEMNRATDRWILDNFEWADKKSMTCDFEDQKQLIVKSFGWATKPTKK